MKKLISILVSLLILLSSCTEEIPPIETVLSTKPMETTPEHPATFTLDSRYVILRADESTDAVEAAQYIRNAVEAISGEYLELGTDWVKRGQEIVPGDFEILVGATNRLQSAELFATLKRDDWEYHVNDGQIIVCGGGAESTLEAAKAFCADVLGYTGEALNERMPIELTPGVSRSYKHTYSIKNISLNGKPITDYVLAVPTLNSAYREIADYFNDRLSEKSGFQLPIKQADLLELGQQYIELGQKKNELGSFEYAISNADGVLKFSGDKNVISDAIDRYFTELFSAENADAELLLPIETLKGFGGQQNGLVLKKESKEDVADGVEYRLLNYEDINGKPVNAYVLVVEPGKAQVINGTPNGGTSISNVKATTVDAAKAAEKQGYRVLAGVNADFFRINSDYSPQGLCIKDGKILSDYTTNPYFGITNDGKFVIDESKTIYNSSGNLKEAVGGRYIILKNGKIHQIGYGEEFGYTRHPRTAVGFDEEGRLYLLVVDGRQPSVSNGASLTDLAIIMLNLGATEALNLDGGGSSTFILENGDGFRTMNSPSDGSLRKVYNSLLIVLK